ncbi:alcohol dehydrogenase (plasmid) [Citricoccus sp. SGAir0253]|uniref:zinc-dependent alcohol dehydrogenase n=1 Tax=Citricoccus sp. SGAir0253 TaxID=2567881 RepID=UPI0010CD33E9|nr:alcohol dehydrogenase catalytic domain-containing protein [Citricoccus sp. SGAir0253]QCU79554.1 alcohol dehydrogenase [Citricoccus sp. SGAir0253]
MMQALVRISHAPRDVEVVDVRERQPGPGEVRVAVSLCGLCGSDAHVYRADAGYEWVAPATVLGHEAVGVVTAVGSGTPDWLAAGLRVVPMSLTGCGACSTCAGGLPQVCPQRRTLGLSVPGAAAGSCIVPWHCLVPVPDALPDATAVLTEPASVAWRAAVSIGSAGQDDRVVVSGTGAIGLLAALAAQHQGADVTLLGRAGPSAAAKMALADRLGLSITSSRPAPQSVDLWIEASGSSAQLDAGVEALRPGGRLVPVALYAQHPDFDVNRAVRKEIAVLFSYASTRTDYEQTLRFLVSRQLLGEELVSVFRMSEATEALRLTAEGGRTSDGRPLIKAAIAPALP